MHNHAQKTARHRTMPDPPQENTTQRWAYSSSVVPSGVRASVSLGIPGVVDNEGCGKKKSKICCIYHKPRQFDESSSESDSASSDSDSTGRNRDSDRGRPATRYRHAHGCRHHAARQEGQGETVHELHQSDSDVNAYERAPKRKS
ncbi:phosphatase inhibitor-domain-containing protein [Chiua virens]|nr:phosphatase inhibitor-domain-containing protein [Chiua virens]